jgi:serine/threonine protein kinase
LTETYAQLKNPHYQNLVQMMAKTTFNEDHFLALEYCNGGLLSEFIKARGGFLIEADARAIFL